MFQRKKLPMKNYWIFSNHLAKFQVSIFIISIDYLIEILDIRVFKDHIFVQYNRIDDAKKLILAAQIPLIFKGNKLGKKKKQGLKKKKFFFQLI